MAAARTSSAMVAEWQAAYDCGDRVVDIAASWGVHRATVAAAIDTTHRTGRRPLVTPQEAEAAVRRAGAVWAAAEQLGVTVGQARYALWRAGLTNDPSARSRPSLNWATSRTRYGSGWDVPERIRIRDARVGELAGQGFDVDEIADETGIDVEMVRLVLRRLRARRGSRRS